MTIIEIDLKFQKHLPTILSEHVPHQAGIYCVYKCTMLCATKIKEVADLIYVGRAKDVHERIKNHEGRQDWNQTLGVQQSLCFAFAPLSSIQDQINAEAAMINYFKPQLNEEYRNSLPFKETHLIHATWETFKPPYSFILP